MGVLDVQCGEARVGELTLSLEGRQLVDMHWDQPSSSAMCRLVNSAQTTLAGGGRPPHRPSPSLPVNSHSIDFPYSQAILNRVVAPGSFWPRSRAEM